MRIVLKTIAALLTFSGGVFAQTNDRLVGTWKLVSATTSTGNGVRNEAPYGPNPAGLLTYTPDGRMTVIISSSRQEPLSRGEPSLTPVDDQAFTTFLAYAGRYTFTCDRVVHHVEISSVRKWLNTDLTRFIKFKDTRITLVTPPMAVNGKIQTVELVWERLS